jgi:hypothetical protein
VPHFGIILVPVDLRERPITQMAFAARLSPGSAHHLFMVHVAASDDAGGLAQDHLSALAREVPTAPGRGWRVLAVPGSVPDTVLNIVRRERIGLVVLGQGDATPGKLAYELARHTNAVIVVAPEVPAPPALAVDLRTHRSTRSATAS